MRRPTINEILRPTPFRLGHCYGQVSGKYQTGRYAIWHGRGAWRVRYGPFRYFMVFRDFWRLRK